ncbi:hypothetical protein KP509_02G047800 [Ceratopteris richardii]|uniref:Uncharacterized protein n=1 Tax=Ceratopteris richardii TaxID=49495 RepID=A0A8T2VCJ7_CERRI|nr:hypothetical protein KP509_02G047800 [Ceratopteris richardii]
MLYYDGHTDQRVKLYGLTIAITSRAMICNIRKATELQLSAQQHFCTYQKTKLICSLLYEEEIKLLD